MLFQAILGNLGFYLNTKSMPPRMLLLFLPSLILIIIAFSTKKGRSFIDSLSIEKLTLLHSIRIGVEIILYYLFLDKVIPEIMTFEGRNYDILAGILAVFVYYFGFVQKKLSNNFILIWNFLALGLLINIVVTAILSASTVFQKFGFEQPNIILAYFPYVWLPSIVVSIVLFSHLVAIKQLLKNAI